MKIWLLHINSKFLECHFASLTSLFFPIKKHPKGPKVNAILNI